MAFRDRKDAGQQLAKALAHYQQEDCLVLGLPRGGVVVAAEVARALNKPMDVLVVRKLGAPTHPELAIGALGPNDVLVTNQHLIRALGVEDDELQEIIRRERAELDRRLHFFRGKRPFPDLQDKTVILVDDGLATGASAMAAIRATRAMGARRIVLAVPVGAHSTVADLRREVDELICLEAPEFFDAVSHWYVAFPQTGDAEVIRLLEASWGNDLGDVSVKARTIGPP
jgi:putative phosphoribosyl transferase